MREELRRQRDAGLPFASAWDRAVAYALDGLGRNARRDWYAAFLAMRSVWAEAYAGTPAPMLPFVPEHELVTISEAA